MSTAIKFSNEKTRASFKVGTIYAVTDGKHVYYGQVTKFEDIGFFNLRSKKLLNTEAILNSPVLSRFSIQRPTIGVALKKGIWSNLGVKAIHSDLTKPIPKVQWPEGELKVTIWLDDEIIKDVSAFDPSIQSYEIIMAYDAIYHVPKRLVIDYERSEDFEFGGTVLRQRRLKEHLSKKFSNMPHHALPADWEYL